MRLYTNYLYACCSFIVFVSIKICFSTIIYIATFVAETSSGDRGDSGEQSEELVTFSPEQTRRSLASSSTHLSSSGLHPTDPPSMHDTITRNSADDSSCLSTALVESNNSTQNGISIFQGYWFLIFYMVYVPLLLLSNEFEIKYQSDLSKCIMAKSLAPKILETIGILLAVSVGTLFFIYNIVRIFPENTLVEN